MGAQVFQLNEDILLDHGSETRHGLGDVLIVLLDNPGRGFGMREPLTNRRQFLLGHLSVQSRAPTGSAKKYGMTSWQLSTCSITV